jgi:predicted RNase H-like HicB family nuclease
MRHYIGIIHKDAESDFGISFPDFPGCVSAGRTLEETTAMGREALEGHVAVMRDAGEAIPEASTLDALGSRLAEDGGTPVFIRETGGN